MRLVLMLTLVLFGLCEVQAAIKGEEVSYSAGGVTMKGYIAYDDAIKGKRPGILVVHEWWGHNAYARKRADMLATLGYTAMAIDMYGDGKQADHPKDAGKFASEVKNNMAAAKERFVAAMKLLQQQNTIQADAISAIGYCFGGGIVLEMARMGVDLDAVASFHGSLGTEHPAQQGQVKARLLVLHGADDPFVKPEQIKRFNEEMKNAGADMEFVTYKGAKHAFTNPDADTMGSKFNIPLAYNADADKASWDKMKAFLSSIYKH